MNQKRLKSFGILLIPVAVLLLTGQGCIPPNLNGEWKDYEKRWHVCFRTVTIGRTYSISQKFMFQTLFDTGTTLKVRGDFDPLDSGDVLPSNVTWKFEHFRKGTLLFEDSFPVPLNQAGSFPNFGVTLISPIVFQKNDLVRFSYTGINVPHDTDVRLKINF